MKRKLVVVVPVLLFAALGFMPAVLFAGAEGRPSVTSATINLCFDSVAFTERLSKLRAVLSEADPDADRYQQTWAALNTVTRLRDEAAQSGADVRLLPEYQTATRKLAESAFAEDAAIRGENFRLAVNAALASGLLFIGTTILGVRLFSRRDSRLSAEILGAYEEIQNQKSHRPIQREALKSQSLPSLLNLVLGDYREVNEKLTEIREQQFRNALKSRERKRQSASLGNDEPPIFDPTDPKGPNGKPDDDATAFDEPAPIRETVQGSDVQFIFEARRNTEQFGQSGDAFLPVESEVIEFRSSTSSLRAYETPLGVRDLDIKQVAHIQIEHLDTLHHLYGNKSDAVVNRVMQHIIECLLEHNVERDELAVWGETVQWGLVEENDPAAVEAFILDCYHGSPLSFRGEILNPPAVSVSVHSLQFPESRAVSE